MLLPGKGWQARGRGGSTQSRASGSSLQTSSAGTSTRISRNAKSMRTVSMFYSNITTWGPQAKRFLSKEEAHVLLICEHHLDSRRMPSALKEVHTWNRRAHFSLAQTTGLHVSATSGGQMLLSRPFLGCQQFDEKIVQQILPREAWQAPRWTASVLRTKGVSILLVVVYLRTAEGLSEANLAIISQLGLLALSFRGQVIMVGDWQITPEQMATTALIRKSAFVIHTAVGADATCKAGPGRLIDFVLATPAISPYLLVTADFDVPWKDHVGIRISFPARLRAYNIPTLCPPRPLPPLPLVDGHREFDGEVWTQAERIAAAHIQRKAPGSQILGCSDDMFSAMQLNHRSAGQKLCLAATTVEAYTCVLGGLAPAQCTPYLGRGGFPHVTLKPVVGRQYLASKYSAPAADFWANIEANLEWLLKCGGSTLDEPCKAIKSVKLAVLHLRSRATRFGEFWSRAAAPNAPAHAWVNWVSALTYDQLMCGGQGYTQDRVKLWITRAAAQKAKAISIKNAQDKKSFRDWLTKDLSTGAAGAHVMVKESASLSHNDISTCQQVFDQWGHLWQASYSQAPAVAPDASLTTWIPWRHQLLDMVKATGSNAQRYRMLAQVRDTLRHDQTEVITPEQVQQAAKSYPARKAKGADAWDLSLLGALPSQALTGLAEVLTTAHNQVCWPPQMQLNVMSLLPKPQGGERSVAKTPMLYRVWNIIQMPSIRQWSKDTCPPWDYCSQGRSAAFSCTLRSWVNETARLARKQTASILWDVEKFFDSIHPADVVREGIRFAYPARALLLGLQMHMAPRCLIMQKVASNLMITGRSILAGCNHSCFFARLVMHRPIERMIADTAGTSLRVSSLVDDIAQAALGTLQKVSLSSAVAAVSFCASMKSLRLKLSHKSVIVSSSPKISAHLASVLRKLPGVQVKCADAARDLGVINSASARRNTSIQHSRLSKAGVRLRKIAPLAKTVRAARVLIHTGAVPAAVWGAASLGVSQTVMSKFRSHVAASTGITAAGRCATTAIALAVGPWRDPYVSLPMAQVSMWMDLWKADDQLRVMNVRHWSQLCDDTLHPPDSQGVRRPNWNKVTGPAGATVATLHDLDWDITNVAMWRDSTGQGWIPDFSRDKQPFVQLVGELAQRKLWKQASQSYLGAGLQDGVSWKASVALHTHLRAKAGVPPDDGVAMDEFSEAMDHTDGRCWHAHSLTWLELFMCAGYWTQKRASAVHGVSAACPRCGLPETELHLIWSCSANDHIADERVVSTQQYIRQATQGASTHPCLWLRGLLPSSLVIVNTPYVQDMQLHFVGDYPAGTWPCGLFYSDASGGPFSSLPPIRRCGVGVAVIEQENGMHTDQLFRLKWGVFAPLVGTAQSVPRAELYAVLVVVLHVQSGPSEIRSDSKVNVDMFAQGQEACLNSVNSDLWQQIWSALTDRQVQLTFTWVKGHADNADTYEAYNVQPADLYGNLFADKLAERAAVQYQVYTEDSFAVQWYFALVRKIQERAIVILTSCMQGRGLQRAARVTPALPPLSPSANAILSQHRCTLIDKQLHCNTCFQVSPVDSDGRNRWLATSCTPNRGLLRAMYAGSSKPTSVPTGTPVRIGRSFVHDTHKLSVFRGLFFCMHCGYHGSQKAQMLLKPCQRAAAKGWEIRKLDLLKGNLPSGLKRWPNEFQTATSAQTYTGTMRVAE